MPELLSVNLRDLYDTDSDEEVERPCYSPLSSVSSMEASVDDGGLVFDDGDTNEDSSGAEDE